MNRIINILENNLDKTYEGIGNYCTLVKEAHEKIDNNPDITIDCCKSLIEGFSRFVIKALRSKEFTDEQIKGFKVKKAYEHALKGMQDYVPTTEKVYLECLGRFFEDIISIRNDRGEVSHGRLYPRPTEEETEPNMALLIYNLTEHIIFYLLTQFAKIDPNLILKIKYEDYPDFNEMLDERYNLPGKVNYSEALYEKDIETYEDELNIFLEEKAADDEHAE